MLLQTTAPLGVVQLLHLLLLVVAEFYISSQHVNVYHIYCTSHLVSTDTSFVGDFILFYFLAMWTSWMSSRFVSVVAAWLMVVLLSSHYAIFGLHLFLKDSFHVQNSLAFESSFLHSL